MHDILLLCVCHTEIRGHGCDSMSQVERRGLPCWLNLRKRYQGVLWTMASGDAEFLDVEQLTIGELENMYRADWRENFATYCYGSLMLRHTRATATVLLLVVLD